MIAFFIFAGLKVLLITCGYDQQTQNNPYWRRHKRKGLLQTKAELARAKDKLVTWRKFKTQPASQQPITIRDDGTG